MRLAHSENKDGAHSRAPSYGNRQVSASEMKLFNEAKWAIVVVKSLQGQ